MYTYNGDGLLYMYFHFDISFSFQRKRVWKLKLINIESNYNKIYLIFKVTLQLSNDLYNIFNIKDLKKFLFISN